MPLRYRQPARSSLTLSRIGLYPGNELQRLPLKKSQQANEIADEMCGDKCRWKASGGGDGDRHAR